MQRTKTCAYATGADPHKQPAPASSKPYIPRSVSDRYQTVEGGGWKFVRNDNTYVFKPNGEYDWPSLPAENLPQTALNNRNKHAFKRPLRKPSPRTRSPSTNRLAHPKSQWRVPQRPHASPVASFTTMMRTSQRGRRFSQQGRTSPRNERGTSKSPHNERDPSGKS